LTGDFTGSATAAPLERYEGSWEKPGKSLITASILGLIIVGVIYYYGLNLVAGIALFTKSAGLKNTGGSLIQRMTTTVMATKNPIRFSVMISEFVFMLVPTVWIIRRWHTRKVLSYIRFGRVSIVELLLAVVTAVLFIPVSSYIGEFLLRELHFPDFLAQINDQLFTSYSPLEFVWLIFVVCVTPAVCEETLFRGYFQRTLERTIGMKSLFIAGIIFGLFHVEPINLISLSLLGMLIGFFYYRSKSILPGMAAHFTNNLIAVLSLYKLSNGHPIAGFLSSSTPMAAFIAGILLTAMLVIVYWRVTDRNFAS
jgi:membrane protease YdiL (CAAX protease family)